MELCSRQTPGRDCVCLYWCAALQDSSLRKQTVSFAMLKRAGSLTSLLLICMRAAPLSQHMPLRHSHGCQQLHAGCPTLLATHFQKLEALPEVYPNCKLHHFKVHAAGSSLNFTRQLLPGQQEDLHYGLLLAEAMAMDQRVSRRHSSTTAVLVSELLLCCCWPAATGCAM